MENMDKEEISLYRGLANKILPFPRYVVLVDHLFDEIRSRELAIDDLLDKSKKKYLLSLVNDAKIALKNCCDIAKILNENISSKPGEYLILCENEKIVHQVKERIISLLKNKVNSFVIDSKENKKKILMEYNQSSSKIKILFASKASLVGINNKFDGLILVDSKMSKNFLQELEKNYSILKHMAFVLEFVDNINALDNIYNTRNYILKHFNINDNDVLKLSSPHRSISKIIKKIDLTYVIGLSFDEMIKLINDYMLIKSKNYCQINENDVYRGINLGIWKKKQITKYAEKKLSSEEERILRQLGENFVSVDDNFIKMVNLISEYLAKTGKDYLEIKKDEHYKGVNIGIWVHNQRYNYHKGLLSKEKEELLRNLGEIFSDDFNSFEGKIKIIKEFLFLTGKTYREVTKDDVYQGINIYNWRQTQRQKYNKGLLSKKQELLLREIGEDFIPLRIRKVPLEKTTLVKESKIGEVVLGDDDKILSKRI